MTRVDLIRRSLRLIGALAPGEGLDPLEEQDAATTLQAMFDTFAAERLTIHRVERAVFDLISGKGLPDDPYTIGEGGDFDTPWPTWIEAASVIQTSNSPNQPLELPITIMNRQAYQNGLPVKNVTSTLIQGIYYEKAGPPLGFIYVWPIVNIGGVQIALYLPRPITGFESPATNYVFPPGYEEAIVYQLAIRLAPEWDLKVSDTVERQAATYYANLQRTNVNQDILYVDAGLRFPKRYGHYNWRSDTQQ